MSKKQIHKVVSLTAVGYFLPAGSSWVALLALRGFLFWKSDCWKAFFIL